ncbi:YwqG family protein [Streptomyces mobaraensis]|uniref:YwqG family protein n=1 Tax=Streptomyces mobaraensis TaxID=35621 RepID=UPI00331F5364
MTQSIADGQFPAGTRSITDTLPAIARAHLPSDVAERWLALVRPSARLVPAAEGDEPAAVLGGLPRLPDGVEWPAWEGHGPLAFIASVDCAALPVGELDLPLPADGTLSFFYFDGRIDDGLEVVDPGDPETQAGARVVYVPAGTPVSERESPAGAEAYPRVPLAVRLEDTAPDSWNPVVEAEFAKDLGDGERIDDHPVHGTEFCHALWRRDGEPAHRIGGWADEIQASVELEVAHGVLGVEWDDPRVAAEAREWTLLAQFDSDGATDMMWGDAGALYWLIRREDLAERRFERAVLTWQCG